MVSLGRRHREGDTSSDEGPIVRQYRFLLREASPDAVEAAHTEALSRLPGEQRRVVLTAVQRGLVVGQRLQPDDYAQVAHLIVLGERRLPNAFLKVCQSETLLALAQAVIDAEACVGLLGNYAVWGGADPESDDPAWGDAGCNPDSGRWNTDRIVRRDWERPGVPGKLPRAGGRS